jgi:hypothetical protein
MSYAEHWFALATRIRGLQSAGELYARFEALAADSFGSGRYLRDQCRDVIQSLEDFRNGFANSLPPEAKSRLIIFLETRAAKVANDPSSDQGVARAALVGLVALESEITFILSGRQEQIKVRSERAFMLLQRILAVDDDVKAKWSAALAQGEVACEKLGSVHLLSQGIYAFKIDTKGARTDLVFPEPRDQSILERNVEGFVLTEWKKATTAKEAADKIAEARQQADLYVGGPLAGIELTGYRYLIVVSENELTIPADDNTSGGVVYRHINIVVNADVPSRAARRRPATKN